ncbi:MAG: bifunctional glutamate N-acetyltransferase/amino-acid acetyltransferase ArgJ [Coriobacteriales bacterium]|nr:bifunctional glutamate N-acetyltransferase/amino-acid acetyltransferase ArgJ [Coriobacteriales bacterium]
MSELLKIEKYDECAGGVCAAHGYKAYGLHAGFKKDVSKPDLACVISETSASCAGTFTQNQFCAAPVLVSREVAKTGTARCVVLNSGGANAATGDAGIKVANEVQEYFSSIIGCKSDDVFIASTGVIGVPLPILPFKDNASLIVNEASCDAKSANLAALAIMTTDTVSKEYAISFDCEGKTYTIGGMCKGSGMISPNMATMLCVLTTDYPISHEELILILRECVFNSFNKVTVDSDTSTNDSVFMLAKMPDEDKVFIDENAANHIFASALLRVCENLAIQIAKDGEGATKLVTINVSGAKSKLDANTVAKSIANSPLVKTAIAGHDCNWGRVAGAAGKCGVEFDQAYVDISFMGMCVCKGGLAQAFDEQRALELFENDEIVIDVDLGSGEYSDTVWTCDLTHDYISINADYRS